MGFTAGRLVSRNKPGLSLTHWLNWPVHAQFLNAAVRMSSGSLGMGGLGTFGSEQLPDSLGMGGSSSALNIAALNPAGSGRLPDLSPIGRVSSGR